MCISKNIQVFTCNLRFVFFIHLIFSFRFYYRILPPSHCYFFINLLRMVSNNHHHNFHLDTCGHISLSAEKGGKTTIRRCT